MELLRNPSLAALARPGQHVLLIASPAVDVRLPWARWQQPVGLLHVGAALRAQGCDVRLIDCLQSPAGGRLAREHVSSLDVEGNTIDLWRFGLTPTRVLSQLRAWGQRGWHPDRVLVSCILSTWWQGARDLVAGLRRTVLAPVYLGGAYATLYPEHAAEHVHADAIVIGDVPEAQRHVPDLDLYRPGPLPRFAGIHLLHPSGISAAARSARDAGEIAREVAAKAGLGVTTIALFDDWLGPEHYQPLSDALEAIAALRLARVRFVTVGNVSPRLIDDELARRLQRAGFRHVSLHDDLRYQGTEVQRLSTESDYAACVRALHKAGFRPRTDEVSASVAVGFPGEDLGRTAERLVRLASVVGSINLVPYQFTPGMPEGEAFQEWLARHNGHLDPTALNAQLYPLARLAGATMEDYRELTRLAALLNSKYRSRTFDFLGNTLTASLLRASLRDGSWDPLREPPQQKVLPAGITQVESQ